MTPLTATDTSAARSADTPAPSLATRALDLVASEWTKFRSVRSSFWSLLVAIVTPIGVSALVAFAFTNAPASAGAPPDPLLPEVLSLEYAVIAVSVMGVLAFSAEYSTGLIRTTFTAAPRRRAYRGQGGRPRGRDARRRRAGRLHLVLSRPGHPGQSPPGRVGVPARCARGGAGSRLLLCVCTMLGLALGSIIRHTAGGIAATIAVIVLPSILGLLPAPGTAGSAGSPCWTRPARWRPCTRPLTCSRRGCPCWSCWPGRRRAGRGRDPHHPPGQLSWPRQRRPGRSPRRPVRPGRPWPACRSWRLSGHLAEDLAVRDEKPAVLAGRPPPPGLSQPGQVRPGGQAVLDGPVAER